MNGPTYWLGRPKVTFREACRNVLASFKKRPLQTLRWLLRLWRISSLHPVGRQRGRYRGWRSENEDRRSSSSTWTGTAKYWNRRDAPLGGRRSESKASGAPWSRWVGVVFHRLSPSSSFRKKEKKFNKLQNDIRFYFIKKMSVSIT